MKIKNLHEEERPREKMFSRQASSLTNCELLAVLLRTGQGQENAVDLSRRLMDNAGGGLIGLFNMDWTQLKAIKGIGPAKAAAILAACELGKRFIEEKSSVKKVPIVSSRQVYEFMLPKLKGLDHEECWIMLLNDNNYLITCQHITTGGSNATIMDSRAIVRKALEQRASGIILVHNHPSCNPRPSKADAIETEKLKKAAETCSISLLDHVIVSDDSFYSFSDERIYGA